jgi:VWFA-related protein
MRHIRFPRPALSAGAVVLIAFSLAGQQQQPQAPVVLDTGEPATFSTGTNLVVVDVSVKDKSGAVIQGLKASDFKVTEDGKTQKISVFEFQKLASDPEPPPPLTLADQLELPPAPKTTITVARPNEVTHHDKRLLALFFDFSSMQIPEQLRAQDAALEFLSKNMSKDDLVAVMLYTSQIQIKSDFTNDRDVLTRVIKALPIGEMSELADLADTGDENSPDTGAAFVADETEFNVFNTDNKLAAIQDAARMLKAFPEKKQLIYLSGGVSKTGIDNQAQLDASVNAAYKANMSIYSIDVRGLQADPPGGAASQAGSRGGSFNGGAYNSQRANANSSQETLVTLAKDTGGKAFLDSNDIALGIAKAQQDVQSYYIVGYYTTNTAEDGKYRKIKVELTNGMSAGLDYRQGYYADKNWSKLNSGDKEQRLREALSAADPVTDLPLALQVDYFRISPTAYFVPVSVKVPSSVIELAAKGGAKVTQFDFIGQIQDDRHSAVGNVRDNIKVSLDKDQTTAQKNFQYNAGFTLGPGKYVMKFLVQENITGKMGTFEAHFTIPDLSADTSGLKLSSIIWSSQKQPLSTAVGVAQKLSKKEKVADPLVDGDEKLVPNITKVFKRSQDLYVAFDVYDAKPDPQNSMARKVKVSMSFFNDKGAKAFEVQPLDETEVTSARPEAVPVKLQVPLKELAPGRYVCQINVVDEVGRKFAFPRTPLVVLP